MECKDYIGEKNMYDLARLIGNIVECKAAFDAAGTANTLD